MGEAASTDGRRFTLLIRDENDGMLWAEVEELPGCFASGVDRATLLEAATEAIHLYLGDADAAQPATEVVPLAPRGDARPPYADRAEIRLRA